MDTVDVYTVCTSKSMCIMAPVHEAKADRVRDLNMLLILSPNKQKHQLQYTNGRAVCAPKWTGMIIHM